jgi:hypothetical protein
VKKHILFLLVIHLAAFTLHVSSQNTMYFMDRLPQNLNYNPALVPKVNFFIQLPGVGLEQAEFYNSGFNVGEFIDYTDALKRQNYKPDEFIQTLKNVNNTLLETRTNILSFGFKLKHKGYFSVSLSERNFYHMEAPREILYLFADFEKYEEKMPFRINGINTSMNAFSQIAFTWSRVFMEKLTIGISPKITGLLAGFRSEATTLKVSKTGVEEYELRPIGTVHVGTPVPVNPAAIKPNGEFDEDENILPENWLKDFKMGNMFRNAGFAFDLGANYELNDKWSFSASVLDVGKSRWRNNDYLFTFTDSVNKISNHKPFTLQVPVKLFLAANYQISPKWNTGFVLRNVFNRSSRQTSATISLNGYVGKMLSTSLSYTAAHKYDNLGFGLRLRFLPGTDFFLVTDNILQAFNYKNTQQVSVSFGMNLVYGIWKNQPSANETIPTKPD